MYETGQFEIKKIFKIEIYKLIKRNLVRYLFKRLLLEVIILGKKISEQKR